MTVATATRKRHSWTPEDVKAYMADFEASAGNSVERKKVLKKWSRQTGVAPASLATHYYGLKKKIEGPTVVKTSKAKVKRVKGSSKLSFLTTQIARRDALRAKAVECNRQADAIEKELTAMKEQFAKLIG